MLQAELLHAAHTARLAGLPRAWAAAVSVVTEVRAARSADPGHRLADLAGALAGVLGVAHRLPHATGPDLTELRGTVRQPYRPDGSLRLYGLFSEPVLTATGYASGHGRPAESGHPPVQQHGGDDQGQRQLQHEQGLDDRQRPRRECHGLADGRGGDGDDAGEPDGVPQQVEHEPGPQRVGPGHAQRGLALEDGRESVAERTAQREQDRHEDVHRGPPG
ncbi:hypothetical protein SGRIM128S_01243 [Streptomyces griseomycini]